MNSLHKPIKSAIIGTGSIAAQHLRCLTRMPDVQIVGVCDLSPALAESTAERYGVANFFTDHEELFAATRPDVVHVTTPPQSHLNISLSALSAGAHVIVEKPLASDPRQVGQLLEAAASAGRDIVEDYNYLYNAPVVELRRQIASGVLGDVVHVDVFMSLDILGKDSRFADPNLPHPCLSLPGGAIYDFLTHFSYLVHAFIGAHRDVNCVWSKRKSTSPLPADEFRALIHGECATASMGFSSHAKPNGFWLRVYATKANVAINLFENRITVDRLRDVPRPLMPLLNGLEEARTVRRAAVRSLWNKLSGGPGAYDGLWTFLNETYAGWLNRQNSTKVHRSAAIKQIWEVNQLVGDLTASAPRISQDSSRISISGISGHSLGEARVLCGS